MDKEMARGLKLKVADIVLGSYCDQAQVALQLDEPHSRFRVEEGHPEVRLNLHYGYVPHFGPAELGERIFDSGSHWSLHYKEGRYIVPLVAPPTGPIPYRVAIFVKEFQEGTLFIRPYRDMPNLEEIGDKCLRIAPFEYPMDELLMVNLLARGRGINLHGCGVKVGERGFLFCGTSGAGKSTLANLWKARQVPILSDDRLIVRRQDRAFFVHGTPWHGDARTSLNEKVRLGKIFFLKQASKNTVTPLTRIDAAARMLVVSFVTFYYPEGMDFTLSLIHDLVQEVPCYELGFTPDQRAIDTVLSDE